MISTEQKQVSIIIPTFKRPEGLTQTLNSIRLQTQDLAAVEILVVNNSMESAAEVEAICDHFLQEKLPVRLFHQPLVGSSQARNMGIEQAAGKWLCFIDDDEELVSNYLKDLFEAIATADENCIFGGPYIPVYDAEKPRWLKEDYFAISYGETPRDLLKNEFLPGGNLILSKRMLEKIGGYSTYFGHVSKKSGYGEDTELVMRAVKVGGIQKYLPSMAIKHHIPANRLSLKWMKHQKKLSAITKARLYTMYNLQTGKRISKVRLLVGFWLEAFSSLGKLFVLGLNEPFRDKQALPYRENYWIEKVSPVYVRYRINCELASIVLHTKIF
jgi:glycosyltransferase involved in cell wall biosynthesis